MNTTPGKALTAVVVLAATILTGCRSAMHHDLTVQVVGGTNLTLDRPTAITAHPQGGILVTDSGNHRIVWLDDHGQTRAQWGTRGSKPGQFMRPLGIATDSRHRVYVADYLNDRIQVLTANGDPIAAWSSLTHGDHFNGPADVAVDTHDNIYVVEFNGARVIKLDPNGRPVKTWGEPGHDPGQLYFPTRISVDPSGNIWVTDTYNHRLVTYDPEGNLIKITGSKGSQPGQFNIPGAVAFDADAQPWVADFSNNRIQHLTNIQSPQPTARTAHTTTAGPLRHPLDIIINNQTSTMHIVDHANNRILRIHPLPTPQNRIQP